MKSITLDRQEVYNGNLLLVNAHYPLRKACVKGLTPAAPRFPHILISRDAANNLQLILAKISAGDSIIPISGYRSVQEQTRIYTESLTDNGEEFTRKFVALPDHSEHQTGLAIDLGLNKPDIDFICPEFPYEGICDAFRKTAPCYGFIQRYAYGREEITGISHEPWHFRYVGYPHSKIMTEKDLSLEEYMDFIKSFCDHYRYTYKDKYHTLVEVYYVPAADNKTIISVPDRSTYQISGNNMDGFIVTVWRNQ